MTLFSRFQEEIKKNNLIKKSDRILVAFSGGKDSVCLLFLLQSLREKLQFDLGACHIHHGIRGPEADDDLSFCKKICQEKNIPFFFDTVDVPAFCKKNHFGLEEGARILRYDSLERISKLNNYNKIATAHTASDQAETILFRLIRGSGFEGLIGIPSHRGNIIRPLLSFYQEEILDFLINNHIEFKKDSSNCDMIYSRNRLRGAILPEIKKINPAAENAFLRFSSIAKEQHNLICALCNQWERDNKIHYESGRIPLEPLLELVNGEGMAPVFREIISRMAKKEKIVIDFQHFEALYALLKRPLEGKIIEIANGFAFRIENESLIFALNEIKSPCIQYQVQLNIGENKLPISDTILDLSDKRRGKVENFNKKLLIIHAAFDKIEGNLFARNRREGDTIQIGGMTRNLKKLFQEAKIPNFYRNRLPIICDDKGIIWIPYIGLCDRVRESSCDEIFTMELRSSIFPPTD